MKRRRSGGDAAPQAESCDVWLDTAELKQGPAQSLLVKTKASRRILGRTLGSVSFTQTRAPQPRTKQTTISAFFRTQTDEKDKENSQPSPFILNKDSKEQGTSLPASPVKILALPRMEEAQKRSGRAGEGKVQIAPQHRTQHPAPASPAPSPGSCLLQAESHSVCGLGEDCCCFSFTQDSQDNGLITHRHEPDLFAGKLVLESGSLTSECGMSKQEAQPLPEEAKTRFDFRPRLVANQSQKLHGASSINSLSDFSETENINPALTRGSTRAAGLSWSPQRPARAQPLRERSRNAGAGSATELWGRKEGQGSPCRQLFTQDSEGNRVIAHRCQNVPSPRRDQGSSGGQLPNSPGKRGSLSQFDLCYDLLFTQDSEGNRVIKH